MKRLSLAQRTAVAKAIYLSLHPSQERQWQEILKSWRIDTWLAASDAAIAAMPAVKGTEKRKLNVPLLPAIDSLSIFKVPKKLRAEWAKEYRAKYPRSSSAAQRSSTKRSGSISSKKRGKGRRKHR